jgi:hypothetical protein
MRKYLLSLVVFAIMAVSVFGQTDKNTRTNIEPAKQERLSLNATNGEQGRDNYGNNKGKPDSASQGRDASFKWPQWMQDSNWWLVIISALTGGIICCQFWEIRRQITLQSIAMRQWINIEPVKVSVPPTFNNPLEITLQFEVRNKTDYLITIKKIVAHASLGVGPARTFTVSHSIPVPPEKSSIDGGHPFYVIVFMDQTTWTDHGAIFVVNGEVTYMDCMDIKRAQSFEELFQGYRDGRLLKMKPSGITPEVTDYEAEEENQA